MTSNRKMKGFTIVELIVVVTIAGVLVTLAIPNLRDVIRNSRITSAHNELVATLNLARSEALKRHAQVRVCAASAAPTSDNPTEALCEQGTDLSGGWMIVAENVTDPTPEWVPVRVSTVGGATQIITDSTSTENFQIAFDPQGRMMDTASVTFSICDDRTPAEKYGRYITVAQSGLLKASKIPEGKSCL